MVAAFIFQDVIAQNNHQKDLASIDPEPFADNSGHWYSIFDAHNIINPLPGRPRYQPTELVQIGDNILRFQKSNGGWPKNYDVFAKLTDAQVDSVAAARDLTSTTTFDNGTTYSHINALAIIYHATGMAKYKEAALKGLDFVFVSQYPNGGWPQFYPLHDDYSRRITFNDGAFIGIMNMLKDILDREAQFNFIDEKYLQAAKTAYQKGLDCVLKTQVNDAGSPTAWCQQYNEVSLEPVWARKFEPASICNGESASLVLFLMSIAHPSKPVIDAIRHAVAWFESSKIYHTKVKTIPAPRMITPFRVSTSDRVVVTDSAAPPIWTRFYELKTHRPIFCNRDSKIVYSLAEVARERRDGYAWYTYAPQQVLNAYPGWESKWAGK